MSPPVKRAKNKKRTAAPDSTSVNGTSATPSIPAKATGEDSIAGAMGNKDSEDDENSSEEWGNRNGQPPQGCKQYSYTATTENYNKCNNLPQ
mmetsp:Transcript_13902/g.29676  ORF Transcript_13902/g.29676 Transcript_13902/m.29676 type:complete len:92 (+) Transcript_13902:140-415(+)